MTDEGFGLEEDNHVPMSVEELNSLRFESVLKEMGLKFERWFETDVSFDYQGINFSAEFENDRMRLSGSLFKKVDIYSEEFDHLRQYIDGYNRSLGPSIIVGRVNHDGSVCLFSSYEMRLTIHEPLHESASFLKVILDEFVELEDDFKNKIKEFADNREFKVYDITIACPVTVDTFAEPLVMN